MPRDGTETRRRIMDAAEGLILDQGFAATSVDRIIAGAGITKGSFFYHFASKNDLAQALVERYAAGDAEHLHGNLERAERLARDPREQLLVFVGLFEEEAAALTEPFPGCLFASYCYEAGLFNERTMSTVTGAMDQWRDHLGRKLREVAAVYPPRIDVDLDSLAENLWVTFEGAFVLSKAQRDPKAVAAQLRHYRNYLELLFATAGDH